MAASIRHRFPATATDPEAGERPLPLVMFLLHPLVLLITVWTIAVCVWAVAPQSVLNVTPRGTRTVTAHALIYISACLLAFGVASLAVSAVRPRPRLRHARRPEVERRAPPTLVTAKRILAGAVTLGALVWLGRVFVMLGGPQGLASYVGGGQSIADLKTEVTIPAQLPPITTLVHLTPGAVALLVFLRVRQGWNREDWFWFLSLLAVTGVRATVMADRLALIGTVSAAGITYLMATPRVEWLRLSIAGLALIAAGYAVWTFGEFSRSWRDSRPPGTDDSLTWSNYASSVSYANVRLGAYVFTAIDNAVVTIESWPTQSFPEATSPPLAAAGLARFQSGAPDLFETKLNPEFTGFTMPGLFFRDAREFGIVLALYYGAFFGLAWRLALGGSVVGIILYGSTAQIVIDSFRMTYLFDTQGIAAILAAAVVWLAPLLLVPETRPQIFRPTRFRRPQRGVSRAGGP